MPATCACLLCVPAVPGCTCLCVLQVMSYWRHKKEVGKERPNGATHTCMQRKHARNTQLRANAETAQCSMRTQQASARWLCFLVPHCCLCVSASVPLCCVCSGIYH